MRIDWSFIHSTIQNQQSSIVTPNQLLILGHLLDQQHWPACFPAPSRSSTFPKYLSSFFLEQTNHSSNLPLFGHSRPEKTREQHQFRLQTAATKGGSVAGGRALPQVGRFRRERRPMTSERIAQLKPLRLPLVSSFSPH